MTTNRLPDGWEDTLDVDPGNRCARCGGYLDTGPVIQEIARCVGVEYGGLALQAVAVHQTCWELERGAANWALATDSPEALEGWHHMVAQLRLAVEERRREEEEEGPDPDAWSQELPPW